MCVQADEDQYRFIAVICQRYLGLLLTVQFSLLEINYFLEIYIIEYCFVFIKLEFVYFQKDFIWLRCLVKNY